MGYMFMRCDGKGGDIIQFYFVASPIRAAVVAGLCVSS